jgi:polar amino acid transport system substrate-binding protein
MQFMKATAYIHIVVLLMFSVAACADPALKLQIVELPPYMIVNADSSIAGLVVTPTLAAFKKAAIPIAWQVVPAVRQLQQIKEGKERLCSVGWYKTPEREKFAKFSKAILRDSPFVGVAEPTFHIANGVSIDTILGDSKVEVLIKIGFVFGDFLDKKILEMKAKRQVSYGDMPQIFKMIAAGRAQITFAPLDEVQYYINIGVIDKEKIKILTFSDMPLGYNRYLMCSQNVEDKLIDRFNAALAN